MKFLSLLQRVSLVCWLIALIFMVLLVFAEVSPWWVLVVMELGVVVDGVLFWIELRKR